MFKVKLSAGFTFLPHDGSESGAGPGLFAKAGADVGSWDVQIRGRRRLFGGFK